MSTAEPPVEWQSFGQDVADVVIPLFGEKYAAEINRMDPDQRTRICGMVGYLIGAAVVASLHRLSNVVTLTPALFASIPESPSRSSAQRLAAYASEVHPSR